MRIYEGMFVLDDRRGNENWDGTTRQLRGILEKNGAVIMNFEKWDERRLTYAIRGHRRGIYVLTRFTAPPNAVRNIERACQLDDAILRVLFTRDEESEKLHKAGLLELDAEGAAEPSKAQEGEPQPEQAPTEETPPPAEPAQPDAAAQAPAPPPDGQAPIDATPEGPAGQDHAPAAE